MDAAEEHSLPPPPPPPSKSEAYSLSSESTSSDVEGDRQQPSAARWSVVVGNGAEDIDAAVPTTPPPPQMVVVASASVVIDEDEDWVPGAVVRSPLSAEMYFIASRRVVILVSFSLCASTARWGTARRSASNASLISRIRLRSRAFAVFLRYLRTQLANYYNYTCTNASNGGTQMHTCASSTCSV